MSEEQFIELKRLLEAILSKERQKDFYTVEEFAALAKKAEFTIRQACNLGRLVAMKSMNGCGKYCRWVISHAEWLRYQREGFLPLSDRRPAG